ncbi:universal stress protein [Halobaculum sp. MBLA0147]|uniref:universal stress protein n=1 Tax=Halobaculum sp. MBLA0147 TaxID=3079934 RepID=UPI003524918D
MADSVLVGYDGTEQSRAALTYAADEWPDARLTLLYVVDPTSDGYRASSSVPTAAEEWYERRRADAEETLADGVDEIRDRVARVDTDTAVGEPATTVVEYARDHEVDHVVVGSHGRTGVSRLLLGSDAETIVRNSPVPVTVVR